MCKKAGTQEIQNYAYLYEQIKNDNLRQRAKCSLDYYINKAAFYKTAWGWLSFATVALPAVSTFIAGAGLGGWSIAVAGVSALTTVVTGTLALFKFADKKASYRNSAENLKSELQQYISRTGDYKNADDADFLLSGNLEQIIKDGYTKIRALESNKCDLNSISK